MYNFKKFLFLFIVLLASILGAEDKYNPFISEQLGYIKALNENNISQDAINSIFSKQKDSFNSILKKVMSDKETFIEAKTKYDSKIFALEKIIAINKRAGNKYAVIRDEVQVKSYIILDNQNKMIMKILGSLDITDRATFADDFNKHIVDNQKKNESLYKIDYSNILDMKSSSKTLLATKQNILDFYDLQALNIDTINHLYLYEDTMYGLNKYSKYNLISIVLFIQDTFLSKIIDPILEPYGLGIVKILIFIFLILVSYVARKFALTAMKVYILKIESLHKYSKQLLIAVIKPLDIAIIVVNINLVVYVYNNFLDSSMLVKFFDILYALIFTIVIFRIINAIATIKVHEIDTNEKQIKSEIINVGMKIVNFSILILGLLFILHLGGANLTAVLSGLGIGGFAVALAAKDSLANFFGTLSILFSDVFSQGDWIEINGQQGTVVEIGLRVTTLRTFDNALVAIPNSILANQDVKNWNKRRQGRRIKMNLGVKYSSSSRDIKNAVKEIREMLVNHPDVATSNKSDTVDAKSSAKLVSKADSLGMKSTLHVYLDEFSGSSINILIYCFSKTVNWPEWLEVKQDIMYQIMEILEKNNLEFAFPSLSIYKENE